MSDGCEYCRAVGRTLYQESIGMKIYFDSILGKPALLAESVMHCPPYVDCCLHNRPYGTFFWIKYCPECGRKLEGGNDNATG